MHHDIVIIGAGVAGVGIGWELVRRGHDVAILERERVGAGASTAAAGMLAPVAEVQFGEDDRLALELESMRLYPEFVEQLEAASGMEVDYQTRGTLIAAIDRDEAEALDRFYEHYGELGLEAERLTPEEARQREPGLSSHIPGAVFCPNDHQIDPVRLLEALATAFRDAGGILREGCAVEEVVCREDRVRGVRLKESGELIEADRVVVAAGAWTNQLKGLPEGTLPRIRPVRGEMLACELGEPPVIEHVLRVPQQTRPSVYLAPKQNGRLIVGATSEERGFDPTPTAGGLYELLRGAWRAVPAVYDQHFLDSWTGFRPMSLANEPILGPSPEVDGLWVATGHGRNGILLTPVTARAMGAAIDEERVPDIIAEFAPEPVSR